MFKEAESRQDKIESTSNNVKVRSVHVHLKTIIKRTKQTLLRDVFTLRITPYLCSSWLSVINCNFIKIIDSLLALFLLSDN